MDTEFRFQRNIKLPKKVYQKRLQDPRKNLRYPKFPYRRKSPWQLWKKADCPLRCAPGYLDSCTEQCARPYPTRSQGQPPADSVQPGLGLSASPGPFDVAEREPAVPPRRCLPVYWVVQESIMTYGK